MQRSLYLKIGPYNGNMEKEMATHSSILAWKTLCTQRNLVGYSPQGHEESDMTEHAHS